MKRIAFNFAALLTFMTLAMSASAERFVMPPYVDEEGNVHFQKPLNDAGGSRPADELAIERLNGDYDAAIDDAVDEDGNVTERLEDWVNLWTEDGVYISALNQAFGFDEDVAGRDQLRQLLKDLQLSPNGVNGRRHMVTGLRVEFINPRLAIGQSEGMIFEATIPPSVVIATWRFQTVYQKVGGKWLIRQRNQGIDPSWGPASGDPDKAGIFSTQTILNDLLERVERLENKR